MAMHEFNAIVACSCGTSFEGSWVVELMDLQQLEEPPCADQECPACHYVMQTMPYPGWTFFGEA